MKTFKNHYLVLSIVFIAVTLLAIFSKSAEANDLTTYALAGGVAAPSSVAREIFLKVKEDYKDSGKKVVTSYLRVEKALKTGQNSYAIDFTEGRGGSTLDTEQKLATNDQFVVTHIGFFLAQKDSTKPNCEVPQTYPNGTIFANGTSNGFVAGNLECFYNGGRLEFEVGSTKHLEAFDLRRLRYVGAMAQSSATTYSQQDNEAGFYELPQAFTITGGSKHSLNVKAPVSSNVVETDVSNKSNYMVVILHGFLVKD